MENPEVTIVIPTINRPLKLIEAIKSIDNQTFKGNIFLFEANNIWYTFVQGGTTGTADDSITNIGATNITGADGFAVGSASFTFTLS